MHIEPAAPDPALAGLLPGAQYSDAFRAVSELRSLDARSAAERILGRTPAWVRALMGLRNGLVKPFGLKSGDAPELPHIGFFPVLDTSKTRVVVGFDDRHLDFRVVVEVLPAPGQRRRITMTTLVHTHNLLGRVYLRLILPFHRLIARVMMSRAERQ